MSASIISSRSNPLVSTIRLVRDGARRAPADLVFAEGMRVLEEATAAECDFEIILAEEGFGRQPRQQALLETWAARRLRVRFAAGALMRELSDVSAPQGALALVRVPELSLAQAPESTIPLILCLCGIQDPGNLGTLLRTARAAGATLVCATAGTVSARNPKGIRSSAGAFFRLPLVEGLAPEEIRSYCRSRRIPIYQASARSRRTCWQTNFRRPVALLLGNEAHGLLPADWPDAVPVGIQMVPGVESLNVAVAGAILLYEAFRQRSGMLAEGVTK